MKTNNFVAPQTPAVVVDHQVHWYPRSAVEKLMGRSTYPKVERGGDGGYLLWVDEGVSQPLMDRLTVDVPGARVQPPR